jgi:hypothetical protein
VFLYQDYDIRFYCEVGLHHASFATKCRHDVRKLKNAKRVDLSSQMKKKNRRNPHFGKAGTLGACRNSFFGVFGIFLAKKSFQSSKFSEGIFFTWPLFSHFVKGAG